MLRKHRIETIDELLTVQSVTNNFFSYLLKYKKKNEKNNEKCSHYLRRTKKTYFCQINLLWSFVYYYEHQMNVDLN